MQNNNVVSIQKHEGAQAASLSLKEVQGQVQLIQQVMHSVMKKDEHYGVIPGTPKPSLYKAGAEKLAHTFKLAPDYEELSVREDDGLISYRIKCKLIHYPTGQLIASGLGTCNSQEKKYRERSVFENEATEDDKAIGVLREKTSKQGKPYKVYFVPQNPWDLQNTLYKMACKRALVAAVLNATAASDIFTQDLEDMDIHPHRSQPQNNSQPQSPPPPQDQGRPAQSSRQERPLTEAQMKMLKGKLSNLAPEIIVAFLENNFKVKKLDQVPMSGCNLILDWIATASAPKAKTEVVIEVSNQNEREPGQDG